MVKKQFKKVMVIAIAMLVSANLFAQKNPTIDAAIKMTKGGRFLDTNYKVTKPIVGLYINYVTIKTDELKHKVTLEIMNFGTDGNTVSITIDLGNGDPSTVSWSGKNVHVYPCYDQGMGILLVMRGSSTNNFIPCGALSEQDGKWIVMISDISKSSGVSDIKNGMTRAQVEAVVEKLGMGQFKFTRNSGNLKVYSFFWLDQKKQWNRLGTDYKYQLRNDKKYSDFYFDEKGKLVKWLMFI